MDNGPGRKVKLLLERCESGRIGLTANELTWVTGSEGSNPSLSARKVGHRPASANSAPPRRVRRARRSGGKRIGARSVLEVVGLYWLQTLGCPKNQVDSDKLEGYLAAEGFDRADDPADADLVVVNTCAFIEAARQESIDTVLELADQRRAGSRLVVTGCLAERYGDQLLDALPEVDLVAGFGQALTTAPATPAPAPVAVALAAREARSGSSPPSPPEPVNAFDLLELPRPVGPGPLGLREGGRRLRPHLRLLRHTFVPGQATLPPRGRHSGRGGHPLGPRVHPRRRRAAPARGRPGGAGPGLLRARPQRARSECPHRRRPLAHRRPHARRVRQGGAHEAALSVSVRLDRRADRGRPRDGCALLRPVAPTRVPPAAGQHAPLGRRRALPAPHGGHPGRRSQRHVPLLVHPRLPGRDRTRPRSAPAVPRSRAAGLGRLLHLLQRGGHARGRVTGPGAARAGARAPARVLRAAGCHHRGQA